MDQVGSNNAQLQDPEEVLKQSVCHTLVLAKCGPCGRIWPLLLPDSKIHTAWEIFGLLLIIYELITLPYKLVFEVTGGPGLQNFDFVSMSYFLTDIVKNFNLCIYQQGLLITQPWRIIKTYLKGWFVIDLVASVPFQYVIGGNSASGTRMLRIVRLARFLKILRLLKVAKVKKIAPKTRRDHRHVFLCFIYAEDVQSDSLVDFAVSLLSMCMVSCR